MSELAFMTFWLPESLIWAFIILLYSIINMEAPYYKATPQGYVLTHRTPPPSADYSKQLPVYRVVSEFMNLEDQKEEKKVKEKG